MAYAIYFDEELVSGGVSITDKSFLDPHLHLVENGAGEFTFTIPPENMHYDVPAEKKTEVRFYLFYNDPEPIFVGFVSNIKYDFWMNKRVTVEGDLAMTRNTIQRPVDLSGKTVTDFLTTVINNHNTGIVAAKKKFTVGIVDYTGKVSEGVINYDTTANILQKKLLDDRAGILAVRYTQSGTALTKYLDYTKETNAPKAKQTIELGQNIIDFEIDMQGDDIVTCVIPLGEKLEDKERPANAIEGVDYYKDITSVNDGNDYLIADSTVTSKFGRIWKILHFDDVKRPARLKTLGENYLSNYQFINMIIKIKAVDLALAFGTVDPFKLSSMVRVISAYHGMDAEFRITEMDIYPDEPEKNTVTCGHSGIHALSSMIAGATGNRYRIDATGVSFTPNPDSSGGGAGEPTIPTEPDPPVNPDPGEEEPPEQTSAEAWAYYAASDHLDVYIRDTFVDENATYTVIVQNNGGVGGAWKFSTRPATAAYDQGTRALKVTLDCATFTQYRYGLGINKQIDGTAVEVASITTEATLGSYAGAKWYEVEKTDDSTIARYSVRNVQTTQTP